MQGKIPQKVTFRVTKKNPKVLLDLAAIATKQNRSRNYVMEQAFIQYISKHTK